MLGAFNRKALLCWRRRKTDNHLAVLPSGGRITCDSVKQLTCADIEKMSMGRTEALGMKANVPVMQALQMQIDGIEKELVSHCRSQPGYRLLNSVTGIGPILATVILLETGSIERFADVGNYASYFPLFSEREV